jgi:putative ABC transport system permease protein
MLYALRTLWHERRRFIPGVFAVAFSCVLIALQAGIFWGLVSVVSVPIIHSRAKIWVGQPNVLAVDLGRPIPNSWADLVWSQPGVNAVDQFIEGLTFWSTKRGTSEFIIALGCSLEPNSLGPIGLLTARQRELLSEPGAVILDKVDRQRLEVDKIGDTAEVFGQRVRVVDFVDDMGSISGPYVLCSLETARTLLRIRDDQTTYLLADCKEQDVENIVAALRRYPRISVFTSSEFSLRSKIHWLSKTKAGIAVVFVAFLGLVVGSTITSQTLYAATAASIKELAVLRAMGIPRWRMSMFVVQQAAMVGILGVAIGIPITYGLAYIARLVGTNAMLPYPLLLATAAITLTMALLSGLWAMRSLRRAEPATLLR